MAVEGVELAETGAHVLGDDLSLGAQLGVRRFEARPLEIFGRNGFENRFGRLALGARGDTVIRGAGLPAARARGFRFLGADLGGLLGLRAARALGRRN
ncbi:hypothetical protein [Nannocystis pusilla]|uniref:hypothetical protein n=1 Tax=Nannocystis pusilla TaxID=889268 RepID=UPI003BF15588